MQNIHIEADQLGLILGLIDVTTAAKLLGLTDRTLRRWRQQRVGPRAVFIGRAVKYQMSELQAWINNSQSHYRPTHARPSSNKKGA